MWRNTPRIALSCASNGWPHRSCSVASAHWSMIHRALRDALGGSRTDLESARNRLDIQMRKQSYGPKNKSCPPLKSTSEQLSASTRINQCRSLPSTAPSIRRLFDQLSRNGFAEAHGGLHNCCSALRGFKFSPARNRKRRRHLAAGARMWADR